MDETLRAFLQEAFGFKKLVWSSGGDDNVVTPLRGKTIDVVFSNSEYGRLMGIAKKADIPVVPLVGHSKLLICKQICEHFKVELNLEILK